MNNRYEHIGSYYLLDFSVFVSRKRVELRGGLRSCVLGNKRRPDAHMHLSADVHSGKGETMDRWRLRLISIGTSTTVVKASCTIAGIQSYGRMHAVLSQRSNVNAFISCGVRHILVHYVFVTTLLCTCLRHFAQCGEGRQTLRSE